jgi:hypothetical protein
MFTLLLSQPPTPLNQAKPGLRFPAAVEKVVMKGLARAPGDRYPDIETFARELAAALALPPDAADAEAGGLFSKMRGLFGGKK